MGILKLLLEILDYPLTMLAAWFVMDLAYQLAIHSIISIDILFSNPLSVLIGFRPDFNRFKAMIMIAQKIIEWLIK